MSRSILYCYPNEGGVGLYANLMLEIYQTIKSTKVTPRGWSDEALVTDIAKYVASQSPDIVHFEIGANQSALYRASRMLLRSHPSIKQVVTLHDLQPIIAHPFGWQLPAGRTPSLVAKKILRRVMDNLLGQHQVNAWLTDPAIQFITLRPNGVTGASYLPQPTYGLKPVRHPAKPHLPIEVGFLGYWGESKGLTTLLDAWMLGFDETKARLTIYGDSYMPGDHFADSFKQQVSSQPGVCLGGVPKTTNDLVDVIQSLDVIVMPYWPDNPAGVSAVAMRAAEAGVPIVASRVPQLEEVLGDDATYYEPPKSPAALHGQIHALFDSYSDAHAQAVRLQRRLYRDRSPKEISLQLAKIIDQI